MIPSYYYSCSPSSLYPPAYTWPCHRTSQTFYDAFFIGDCNDDSGVARFTGNKAVFDCSNASIIDGAEAYRTKASRLLLSSRRLLERWRRSLAHNRSFWHCNSSSSSSSSSSSMSRSILRAWLLMSRYYRSFVVFYIRSVRGISFYRHPVIVSVRNISAAFRQLSLQDMAVDSQDAVSHSQRLRTLNLFSVHLKASFHPLC